MTQEEICAQVSEFHRLGAEIERHRVGMSECGAERRNVVRQMNAAGIGYGKIAELCGVSKGLIQMMMRVRARS